MAQEPLGVLWLYEWETGKEPDPPAEGKYLFRSVDHPGEIMEKDTAGSTSSVGGGGGGGAPTTAEYVVNSSDASLANERVLTDTATIAWDDGTAGQMKANVPDDAITYAKMQNVSATDKLLGRSTAGAGNVEEIACTAAGRALIDDANAAAQRTTLGLSTITIYDREIPPSSPHAMNDEFNGTSLDAKWTEFDHGSVLTPVVGGGAYISTNPRPGGGGDRWSAIHQSIPAGDWTAIALMRVVPADDSFNAGMVLLENATSSGDLYFAGLTRQSGFAYGMWARFNAYNNHNSNIAQVTTTLIYNGMWIKVVKSSTTYTAYFSFSGRQWAQIWTGTLTFTPTLIGVGTDIWGAGSGTVTAEFDFFRFYTVDPNIAVHSADFLKV